MSLVHSNHLRFLTIPEWNPNFPVAHQTLMTQNLPTSLILQRLPRQPHSEIYPVLQPFFSTSVPKLCPCPTPNSVCICSSPDLGSSHPHPSSAHFHMSSEVWFWGPPLCGVSPTSLSTPLHSHHLHNKPHCCLFLCLSLNLWALTSKRLSKTCSLGDELEQRPSDAWIKF